MGKRGPKPKPKEELHVTKSFKFAPELWAQVEAWIPRGERSALLQGCLKREVDRRRKKALAEREGVE